MQTKVAISTFYVFSLSSGPRRSVVAKQPNGDHNLGAYSVDGSVTSTYLRVYAIARFASVWPQCWALASSLSRKLSDGYHYSAGPCCLLAGRPACQPYGGCLPASLGPMGYLAFFHYATDDMKWAWIRTTALHSSSAILACMLAARYNEWNRLWNAIFLETTLVLIFLKTL